MPGVPNTFANASGSIPLSQLDANFNTTLTIGTTSVGLGNTISTISNVAISTGSVNGSPVGNVTPSSGAFTTLSATGNVTVADGTVSVPAIAFTSDPDNGFYRIGTNNWALSCAGAKVMEFKSGGEITMPLQPAFSAYNTTTRTNKTGNGSMQTVDMDAEVFDQNGDFNTGTSVFTAPVDGKYMLSARVLVNSLGSATNDAIIFLTTSNRQYSMEYLSGTFNSLSALTLQISQLCDMDAGDTAYVQVTVYGMAGNTAGFHGGAAGYYTAFSGNLAC